MLMQINHCIMKYRLFYRVSLALIGALVSYIIFILLLGIVVGVIIEKPWFPFIPVNDFTVTSSEILVATVCLYLILSFYDRCISIDTDNQRKNS